MLCFKRHPDELALPPFCSGFQTFENWQCLGLPHLSLLCDWSIYLSVRVFNICRRLPQTKRHSSLFLHWSGSKLLVVMAVCTPPIHVFNSNYYYYYYYYYFYLFTAIRLSPDGSGWFTGIKNMKLVTNKFKSGGLHEKHVVATWNLGNHLSICF